MACALLDINGVWSFAKQNQAVLLQADDFACRIHMLPTMPWWARWWPALQAAVCNNRYALNSDICSLHDSLTIVQHCLYSSTFWLVRLTVIAMLYCHILVNCCGRLHRCHCAMLGCLRISACGFKPLAYTTHVQIKQMIVAVFCLQDECTTIISRELMHRHIVMSIQLHGT